MKGKWLRAGAFFCGVMVFLTGCAGRLQSSGSGPERTDSGSASMGRYMETFYELPEEINRNGGMCWLSDESLALVSFGEGLYRSADEGQTWVKEETDWFPMLEGVYCLAAVVGPDGTVAASCSGGMPEAARAAFGTELPETWEGNYCVFGFPDGTVKVVDFGFSQDDGSCIKSFVFKEDGRLFAGDMQGKVYEVDLKNMSLKELFSAGRAVGYLDFCQEILMAVGYDRLYLYDLRTNVLRSQDETVDAYIRQVLLDGTVSYTSGGFPLAVAGGLEENVIYIASGDGMYRHVLWGSMMEQIIDGALSTLGDSFASIYRIKVLEDQEFLVAFSPSEGLVRYCYDASVPSMPDRELRIYSLEENQSVRQAVSSYKKEHPDLYIRYEVGLEAGGGMTREDAVKRLNTQVLAGEGPDILLLDGLPAETYMEKGMLKDIRPILEGLPEEEALFANVVDSFTDEDGAVYTMPMCIRVPLLVGDREQIAGMNDLESIAAKMENRRAEYPQGGIFGIQDPEAFLRLFGMVSASTWQKEEGQLDQEAVFNFLELSKRIYEAELEGAVPAQMETRKEEMEEMAAYGVDPLADQMEVCSSVLQIPRGYAEMAGGYVEGIQICLDCVTSVLRTDENLDYRNLPGQVTDGFLPVALVGISSRAAHPGDAEDFVQSMFASDTQKNIYEGYPVNRTAYEEHFEVFEEDGDNGSMILQHPDGSEQELRLYWPNEMERQKFTDCVESLKTPVLADDYLCSLVYETGVSVLEGEISVEEGTSEIVKKASIYLAE